MYNEKYIKEKVINKLSNYVGYNIDDLTDSEYRILINFDNITAIQDKLQALSIKTLTDESISNCIADIRKCIHNERMKKSDVHSASILQCNNSNGNKNVTKYEIRAKPILDKNDLAGISEACELINKSKFVKENNTDVSETNQNNYEKCNVKQIKRCNCNAAEHSFYTNCIMCGYIVCEQEIADRCVFCGSNLIFSNDENINKEYSEMLKDKNYINAKNLVRKLLKQQEKGLNSNDIIDLDHDLFEESHSMWNTKEQREKYRKIYDDVLRNDDIKIVSELYNSYSKNIDVRDKIINDSADITKTAEKLNRVSKNLDADDIYHNNTTDSEFKQKSNIHFIDTVIDNTIDKIADKYKLFDDIKPSKENNNKYNITKDFELDLYSDFIWSSSKSSIKYAKNSITICNRDTEKEKYTINPDIYDNGYVINVEQPIASLIVHGLLNNFTHNTHIENQKFIWIYSIVNSNDCLDYTDKILKIYKKDSYNIIKNYLPKIYDKDCILGRIHVYDYTIQSNGLYKYYFKCAQKLNIPQKMQNGIDLWRLNFKNLSIFKLAINEPCMYEIENYLV